MADLVLEGLSLRYGERRALEAIDLTIPDGQLVSVLGPSGGGKTSLLRAIAGLERPSAGRITFDGRDLAGVPAHERGFGLMFQDYALFPHRDVAGNVGFGLRMAGWDAGRLRERVAEMLALVGLPGAQGRSVAELSGGEQQRVALARALAPGPRLLMLDEPMGSLDRALRERLPMELRRILGGLGVTALYVTHDQEEAFGVADRAIVLHEGGIEADGSPEELWTRPPSGFVARFLGFRNVAPGEVRGDMAATPWGTIPVTPGTPDGPCEVVIRPDALELAPDGPIRGAVANLRFRGDHVLLALTVAGAPDLELEVRGTRPPAIDQVVHVRVDPRAVVTIRRPSPDAHQPAVPLRT